MAWRTSPAVAWSCRVEEKYVAMPYVWFLLICFIWGSSFILMKRATEALSPTMISTGRVGFGALVLALVLWRMRRPWNLRRGDFWPMVLIVITGFAWPYTIQPWLIGKYQNSAFIGMTVAFTPLLTLTVSMYVLEFRPSVRQVIGVCGALVCLLVLMREGWRQQVTGVDLALAISVPLNYAIANNGIRRYLAHVPPIELTFACLAGAMLVMLPCLPLTPSPAGAGRESWLSAWGAVMVLGIAGTGLSTCLFTHLIMTQGPLFAAMVTNLVPLGAMAWGWADAETITPWQLLAVGGVLAMVALVQIGAAVKPTQTVAAET